MPYLPPNQIDDRDFVGSASSRRGFLWRMRNWRFWPKNPESVFLAASLIMVVVEVAAASFTLLCLAYNINNRIKYGVTLAYYLLYTLLTIFLIANSIATIRSVKRDFRNGEISAQQRKLKIAEESFTITSSTGWVMLSVGSIVMAMTESPLLRIILLNLSVLAPLFGAISALTRVADTKVSYNKGRCEGDNQGRSKMAWIRMLLYTSLAVFELCHCACHLYEAYLLFGNTHLLFSITDNVLLWTQVGSGIIVLTLELGRLALDKYFQASDIPVPPPGESRANLLTERGADPGRYRPIAPSSELIVERHAVLPAQVSSGGLSTDSVSGGDASRAATI